MDLIKYFDPASAAIQKMTGDRTKLVKIITNVVSSFAFEEPVIHLKENKFSIMTDEFTDVGTVKNLVITVRHFQEECVVDDF